MKKETICPLFGDQQGTGNYTYCLGEKCEWYFKPDKPKAKGSCSIKMIACELTGIQLRLLER